MPQGYSLHIGLNGVDANAYHGWPGTLSGCVNDAAAMQKICASQGFATRCVLNDQATAQTVLDAIGALAQQAQGGDTVVISYSGHGGQVPDTTGTSDNGLDDTWVCYDRMVLGHELYAKWSDFRPGVHIEVYSDSCHSGTVIRELLLDGVTTVRGLMNAAPAYTAVFGALAKHKGPPPSSVAVAQPQLVHRAIPPELALQLFHEDPRYAEIAKPGPISCGVVLISACQDNQVAADGTNNGLFTEKLLEVWDAGAFTGTIPQFHKAIVALMPSEQTPNYFLVGIDDDAISDGRPLTVLAAAAAPASPPTISGPASCDRDGDPPPTFTVNAGPNRYYVVEVATDTACFGDFTKRTATNFFGSWTDGSRLTDPSYTVPQGIWDQLKSADTLFYRAGSTTSQTGWDDYLVSTTDADEANAPSIAITSGGRSRSAPQAPSAAPEITAPAGYARSNSVGPTFIVTSKAPYFVVEVATDPSLFPDAGRRSGTTFYASWNDPSVPPRLTGTSFELPADAWARLKAADKLYYRAGSTTSATGWDNYAVSTSDGDAANAPAIAVDTEQSRTPAKGRASTLAGSR